MGNTRVRCSFCRQYILREDVFLDAGIGRFCSSECVSDHQTKARRKRRQKVRNTSRRHTSSNSGPTRPKKKVRHIPLEVRNVVRDRDQVCRWCARRGSQIHHVRYRSEGGPDVAENLVFLCSKCHERAHTSKAAYQEVLLVYLWAVCTGGPKLFVPEIASRMRRNGELSELQLERFFGAVDVVD